MNQETKIKVLELTYAGALADSVYYYTQAGILDKVTEEKRKQQMLMGKHQVDQFGISKPEEVFLTLSEVFNCVQWQVTESESGLIAEATSCRLHAFAKKLGGGCPCKIYCLNPMEGMVKALNPDCTYEVEETLWDGDKCRIVVDR